MSLCPFRSAGVLRIGKSASTAPALANASSMRFKSLARASVTITLLSFYYSLFKCWSDRVFISVYPSHLLDLTRSHLYKGLCVGVTHSVTARHSQQGTVMESLMVEQDQSPHRRETKTPFFVLGSQRSGTTLLRLMLTSHPNLAMPYET